MKSLIEIDKDPFGDLCMIYTSESCRGGVTPPLQFMNIAVGEIDST